ncbi:MAG: hydrogenase nickel incorporation protein HypB [Chloroflexi bacterium]|nr:hydrogenase nickel incorporation protein HypB [Chloroflexota bacterium]MCL5075448.1 hydrogenase nickel incorporation protein HypB [Chloroflexota bacterium]
MEIRVQTNVLAANEAIATQNRALFHRCGCYALNLMGSPGAGKTSLLERTIEALRGALNIGVIEGDIATSLDTERILRHNVPAVQVNTGGNCHLDARMVQYGVEQLNITGLQLLFIENVGNLVCPAGFDLGEEARITVLSVTEGDDKPLKYPRMFQESTALIINKIDLLPFTDCDLAKIETTALRINPHLKIFEVSCRDGRGIEMWAVWLQEQVERFLKQRVLTVGQGDEIR